MTDVAFVLDSIFASMPSFAHSVLFARRMAVTAGEPDTLESTTANLAKALAMLASVPLEELERRSLEVEEAPCPLLQRKAQDVSRQLERLSQLDKQLNEAFIKLDRSLEEAERRLEADLAADPGEFESLFKGDEIVLPRQVVLDIV